METNWYVLQTKPHQENLVGRRVSELAAEVFLPRIVERVHVSSCLQLRTAPMFPSYLFVNVDLWRSGKNIRYTPGVRDFLRSNGFPQPLESEIISRLRERIGPTGVYEPPPVQYRSGERLRINEGSLRGVDVIFERELSRSERVVVMLAEVTLSARVILPRQFLASA